MIDSLGSVGCKTALRLAELAVSTSDDNDGQAQLDALTEILNDLAGDELSAQRLCEVIL